jgi:hypothetical protein
LAQMERSNSIDSRDLSLHEAELGLAPMPGTPIPSLVPPVAGVNEPKIMPMGPTAAMGKAAGVGALSVPAKWEGITLASAATPLEPGMPMLPTPIAAVNPPNKDRKRNGEELLVTVRFVPQEGV